VSAYPNVIRLASVYLMGALIAGAGFILSALLIAHPYEAVALLAVVSATVCLGYAAILRAPRPGRTAAKPER
jgi:hypothetical protein